MAGLTLQQAQANLDAAQTALAASRQAQDYTIGSQTGSRRVQRASHASLLAEVQYWQRQVAVLGRGNNIRSWSAVPL